MRTSILNIVTTAAVLFAVRAAFPADLHAEPVKGPVAIGCSHQICVAVDSIGQLFYGDTNSGVWSYKRHLPGKPVGPLNISCEDTERCVVTDTTGQVWLGNVRDPDVWHFWVTLPKP